MTSFPEWILEQAKRQGLSPDRDDLVFISEQVARVKAALSATQSERAESLEPPYRFAPARRSARRRRQ